MELKRFINRCKTHLKDKKVAYRLILIGFILLAIILYRFFVYHFTYSSYAFVYANTVNIKSPVSGTLTNIYIKNNQLAQKENALLQLDQRITLENPSSKLTDNTLTTIYAPINGAVTNLKLVQGDYLTKGQNLFALIDTEHWWIITRYRETVLRKIHVGDKVKILIDMYPWKIFNGIVESIDWGINREEASPLAAPSTLPYIQPTEYWIRLSQRYPVWIRIIDIDKDYPLRVGSNARTFVVSHPLP